MSVQFNLSAAHLSRWLIDTDLNKSCSYTQREKYWTRARSYIQLAVIHRLMTSYGWKNITTPSHRKDGVAFVLRGLQGGKTSVLYIPRNINDLTKISLWTPRLEASNLIARGDATLEPLVPPLVDYFYLLQCLLPGSLIITGASAEQVALPLLHWITSRRQELKRIFWRSGYRSLHKSAIHVRRSFCLQPAPTQMRKKSPKSSKACMGSARQSDDLVDRLADMAFCSKACDWCGCCSY